MADKRRKFSMVVVYWRDGRPHSWCTAETEGQALDIARVYRRSYSEKCGFRLVNYPLATHAETMGFRPPPLPAFGNGLAAWTGDPGDDLAPVPDDHAGHAESGL